MSFAPFLGTDFETDAHSEIFGTHSMLVDEAAIRRMWDTFKEATEKMKHIQGFYTAFTFQPISQSAARIAKTNGVGNTWDIDDSKPYLCESSETVNFTRSSLI